jgi:hypothetical protein
MATKKAAKTSVRVTSSKKSAKEPAIVLPSGYRVIGRAPNADFDETPVIEGERGEAREVVFDEGTKKERTLRVMTVVDKKVGAVSVWESAGTKGLFEETEKGDNVRIEYLGLGPKVKGKNQMRRFACSVKE